MSTNFKVICDIIKTSDSFKLNNINIFEIIPAINFTFTLNSTSITDLANKVSGKYINISSNIFINTHNTLILLVNEKWHAIINVTPNIQIITSSQLNIGENYTISKDFINGLFNFAPDSTNITTIIDGIIIKPTERDTDITRWLTFPITFDDFNILVS